MNRNDIHFNVCFVGRFCKGKGIETICEIIEEMDDCRFHFIGQFNGTDKQRDAYPTTNVLYDLAKQYPDRVILTGHIPQTELAQYVKDMDVWLCPSWHCPFELVGLEAMASKVPVILTKTGAFLEYGQHEVNSLMVDTKDSQGLKDAIYRIRDDHELAHRLIDGGLKTIQNHTWDIAVDGLNKVYEGMNNGN